MKLQGTKNEYQHAFLWREASTGLYNVRWQLDDGDIIRYWERKGNGWLEFKTAAQARKKYNEIKKIIEG